MDESVAFSIDRLEYLAYTRQHEAATSEMLSLLASLDRRHGSLAGIGIAPSGNFEAEQRDAHFATRFASALATLFSDPNFLLSDIGFQRLIPLQRWLAIIFGASPLGNADHIIHLFNEQGYGKRVEITLKDRDLLKFSLLYSLDSTIPLQPEIFWEKDKKLAAALFAVLLSSRVAASGPALEKKEQLLEWLPSRLLEVDLDDIPTAIVHDVWMHCSYAYTANKHQIKRAVNQLVRRKLLQSGFQDISHSPPHRSKPVLMCVLEWFLSSHAMYRGHSLALEALKKRYHLVGVAMREEIDDISRKSFDEVHVLPRSYALFDTVRQIHAIATSTKPDIVYYPSVGMFPDTVFLANLRLAPIQMIALGHPATTHSPFIDYVVVEADCIGDAACFSEKLIAVPPEALPYRPPANCPEVSPKVRGAVDEVRIAVAASVMKINAPFLRTLRRIADESKTPVVFHFFTGFALGLAKVYLQNLVRNVLGERAVMFPHLPYAEYLENINRCDMFADPFPFGNTNGIVDTVRQGLPGVCMTGKEVHSHIDEALFIRLGMPSWTITKSPDEYVRAAVRLAEKSGEREKIARQLLKIDPDAVLFTGNANLFCDAIEWVERNHARFRDDPRRVLQPPRKAIRRSH